MIFSSNFKNTTLNTNTFNISSDLAIILIFIILGIFTIFLLILIIFAVYRFYKFLQVKNFNKELKKQKKAGSYYLEELLAAITFFSKNKIGALIVFQRKSVLNNFFHEEGIAINADLSSDLLKSIFGYKKTQLHDGAVIINNQWKIASASVFLPIPKRTKSIKKFGTRHSAAYGIVEKTDAAVCVVSEANGKISFIPNKKKMWNVEKISFLREQLKKELYYV